MTNITETEALNKVAAYCSTAEHCRAEISEKLQRWGLPYDVIDRILKRLVDEKYIDEERFCQMGESENCPSTATEENFL